mmetsp:Transcript_126753/g.405885  ORF Transcript_126753/g.405885 Transcript_126753/m.405885 type:complete len:239 (+) Transcript_126753:525-1241(+)
MHRSLHLHLPLLLLATRGRAAGRRRSGGFGHGVERWSRAGALPSGRLPGGRPGPALGREGPPAPPGARRKSGAAALRGGGTAGRTREGTPLRGGGGGGVDQARGAASRPAVLVCDVAAGRHESLESQGGRDPATQKEFLGRRFHADAAFGCERSEGQQGGAKCQTRRGCEEGEDEVLPFEGAAHEGAGRALTEQQPAVQNDPALEHSARRVRRAATARTRGLPQSLRGSSCGCRGPRR